MKARTPSLGILTTEANHFKLVDAASYGSEAEGEQLCLGERLDLSLIVSSPPPHKTPNEPHGRSLLLRMMTHASKWSFPCVPFVDDGLRVSRIELVQGFSEYQIQPQ